MFLLFFFLNTFAESPTDYIASLHSSFGASLHYDIKEQNETFLSFKCSQDFNLFGKSGYVIAEGSEKGDDLMVAVDVDQTVQYVLAEANEDFNKTRWNIRYLYQGDPNEKRDSHWSGRQLNAYFQRNHFDHFFGSCEQPVKCSENWPKMTGSSTVCTPEDQECYYHCDDPSYFCPSGAAGMNPNIGVAICDPRNGRWTIGAQPFEEACICQKMEYLCQTPGYKGDEYRQTKAELKFAQYGFSIVSGCNGGKVYVSSSNLINNVITSPSVYDPTSNDRTCTMTCENKYEIKNDCVFTTFTCNKTNGLDEQWKKSIWEWTPNSCVPECGYKHQNYDNDDNSDKVIGIVGIVFGSLVLFGGIGFCAFYCWRNKRMQAPEAYAPLNR